MKSNSFRTRFLWILLRLKSILKINSDREKIPSQNESGFYSPAFKRFKTRRILLNSPIRPKQQSLLYAKIPFCQAKNSEKFPQTTETS